MRTSLLLIAFTASVFHFGAYRDASLNAEIAVEASAATLTPEDTAPSVEVECENCRGTGKIGDGRIVYDCPVCGGDGMKECEECRVR